MSIELTKCAARFAVELYFEPIVILFEKARAIRKNSSPAHLYDAGSAAVLKGSVGGYARIRTNRIIVSTFAAATLGICAWLTIEAVKANSNVDLAGVPRAVVVHGTETVIPIQDEPGEEAPPRSIGWWPDSIAVTATLPLIFRDLDITVVTNYNSMAGRTNSEGQLSMEVPLGLHDGGPISFQLFVGDSKIGQKSIEIVDGQERADLVFRKVELKLPSFSFPNEIPTSEPGMGDESFERLCESRSGAECFQIGLSYRRKGELKKAIAAYRESIRLGHGHISWAYNNIGVIHLEAGRFELAKEALLSAIEAGEENPSILGRQYVNLGKAYEGLGDEDNAEASFRKAEELGVSRSLRFIVVD